MIAIDLSAMDPPGFGPLSPGCGRASWSSPYPAECTRDKRKVRVPELGSTRGSLSAADPKADPTALDRQRALSLLPASRHQRDRARGTRADAQAAAKAPVWKERDRPRVGLADVPGSKRA